VPAKRNEVRAARPDWVYATRRWVENLWARPKERRAVATHHEKIARSFLDVLQLAATLDWLERSQALTFCPNLREGLVEAVHGPHMKNIICCHS
jgi:hypothetical protein